ncbi:hypothetical protein Clacol_001842 [Clathrus columnatus]|uniref:HNH nuclease domain-containing protein n=1 Tax=Clathrus columnatus TaxID=1419009 RepID=A0AAV5A2B8_9AGAM|nr:hypothetical protein Clacol_001842 [Clathrus columnatus]
MLYYILSIDNDPTSHIDSLEVAPQCSLMDLRRKIKNENPNQCRNHDPSELAIYIPTISVSIGDPQLYEKITPQEGSSHVRPFPVAESIESSGIYQLGKTCLHLIIAIPSPKLMVNLTLLGPERNKDLFGFTNINDPRNGLLLYKPIEEAYDRNLICFYEDGEGKIRCRVLVDSLKTLKFTQSLKQRHLASPSPPSPAVDREPSPAVDNPHAVAVKALAAAGFITFGDLEGNDVFLRFGLEGRKPYKRVLNFHSLCAYKLALDRNNTMNKEFRFEDFYSNDSEYGAQEVMEMWRKSVKP